MAFQKKKPAAASKAEQAQVEEAVKATRNLAIDTVIASLGTTQVKAQASLAELSGVLTEQVRVLQNIELAIAAKQEELKVLHEIEAEAISVEEMRLKKAEELARLEAEIAAQRDAWEREKDETENQQVRDENEFNYQRDLKRRAEQDLFDRRVRDRNRLEEERQAAFDKDLRQRQEALAAQEEAYREALELEETFESRVKADVDRAVAIATSALKKQYETEKLLASKDAESEKMVLGMQLKSLQEANKALEIQNANLNERLDAATARTTDVAKEALQTISHREASSAVQRTVETIGASSGRK